MKRETTYGQAATGDYIRMPFNRCNLGSEQGLIDDPVLGQGRDPLAPLQDVITDEGDIIVPVDPRYLGLWLTGLFGDPDTTDNLRRQLRSRVRLGRRGPAELHDSRSACPRCRRSSSTPASSSTRSRWSSPARAPAAATINAIAQGETRFGTTQGGTPTSLTFSRISQFQGSIKRAGSAGREPHRRLGHLLEQPGEDRDHPRRRPDRGRRPDHRCAHRQGSTCASPTRR